MTLGSIIGAGIFVTPKGVLNNVGSVGMSLAVWILCGVFSMIGFLCFIELGTSIPASGCHFVYIRESFGEMPAFMYLWAQMVVLTPVSIAIVSITFANYILEPLFLNCAVPSEAIRLTAVIPICLLTYINCLNVQWATRVQDVFTFAKITALIIIIIAGGYHLVMGNSQNFVNAFQGTTTDPGYIALSFYSGLFSYAGWNFLNFVTEELKDPFKNLPRAIYISLPLVTVIYVLANVAYFAVLTPNEILTSNAVAVTFGERILGVMSWIMPFSVALSTFGGLNGNIFASARYCLLSLAYLSTTEVYVLINYTAFVEALFVTFSVAGLLWLRYKQPDLHRPIRVNLILPVTFLIVCAFLVTFPFYASPWETGMGIATTLTGIPVYMVTVYWRNKPKVYKRAIGKVTSMVQKLLLSVPEEKND
ncbi:large neutral amino acids transporter small subunit 2 [Caerostris darwini]|uniref:Large neutral amino acids transporter small subunit 2 n=1 Tax=Caerostris darwini TaxID=1538125 RepID=A0AAV4WC22_9ARAC|nr:large neutral amino acids transporter small subunit 2 [Caerostris darwini]